MFSILAADVTLHGLGSVLFGLAVCITSLVKLQITLSVGMVLFWIVSIACGALFFLLGISNRPIYWIGPVVAAMLCVTVAALFWRFALSRYQSAGG